MENVNRCLLVVFTCGVSLSVYNNMPLLNSISGAVACCPLAFTLPALFHLKLGLAKTKKQKILDKTLIVFSVAITLFTTEELIRNWGTA